MPFQCGEVWRASTYANHGAIDWNAYPSDDGRPVVASAAGTASLYFESIGGYQVIIDHGDGWKTVYAHMKQDGRVSGTVTQGQVIGFVGGTGNNGAGFSSHLHWEQKLNGVRQSTLYANGTTLNPGPTANSSAPSYTSANCPTSTPVSLHLRQYYYNNGWVSFDVSSQTNVNVLGNPSIANGTAWARDTSNHLREFSAVGGGWTADDVTASTGVSILSNPAGASGVVWARDTNNHLHQFYKSGGSWVSVDVSVLTGVNVAGNPVLDSSGTVWIRDDSNHLRQFYYSSGWIAFDATAATGINVLGDPQPVSGGVLARDDSNHLRQFYVSGTSWITFDVSNVTGVAIASNPSESGGNIWARDTNGHLRQFYYSSGWIAFDVTVPTGIAITGNPVGVSGGAWARDTNGHLRQFYVSGTSWISFNLGATTNTTIAGDPVTDYTGTPWAIGWSQPVSVDGAIKCSNCRYGLFKFRDCMWVNINYNAVR